MWVLVTQARVPATQLLRTTALEHSPITYQVIYFISISQIIYPNHFVSIIWRNTNYPHQQVTMQRNEPSEILVPLSSEPMRRAAAGTRSGSVDSEPSRHTEDVPTIHRFWSDLICGRLSFPMLRYLKTRNKNTVVSFHRQFSKLFWHTVFGTNIQKKKTVISF